MHERFKQRLIKLRKEAGKTQEQMANTFGIERTTYGGYERGDIMPPFDKLKAISDYFNVSIDYLIGNTNIKDKSIDHSKPKIHDVSEALTNLINELKDTSTPMQVDGLLLDNESRELLIKSIENSLLMSKIISNKK